MTATLLWFSGAETGNVAEVNSNVGPPSVVTSPVRSGAYAFKTGGAGQTKLRQKIPALGGAATTFFRGYFKTASFPSAAESIVGLGSSSGGPKFHVTLNTDGTIGWEFTSFPGTPVASGTDVISLADWNLLEVKFVRDASVGGMEIKLNGLVQTSSFVDDTTSGTSTSAMYLHAGDVSFLGDTDIYWDDIAFATGGYVGAGQCIAVQGKAGAPTYDAWAKNGAATAALAWSETPYSAAKNCDSVVSGDKQTMLVDDAVLSGPYGVGASDVINGAMIVAVVKCASSFSSVKLLRRVSGSDTVSASRSTGTSDGYVPNSVNNETADVFVDTLANLEAAEIGAQANSSSINNTVEDVWLIVDFSPPPPPPPVASHLPVPIESAAAPTDAQLLVKLDVLRRVDSPLFVQFEVLSPVREDMGALTVEFSVVQAVEDPLAVVFRVVSAALVGHRVHSSDIQAPVVRVTAT